GNFINQEVLGTVTAVPWAIVFGHPIDGSVPAPRHPAQLYEALFYCLTFLVFWRLFPRLLHPVGRLAGLFFIVTFGFRFLVEYVKEEQSYIFGSAWITMGQLLSVPLILFGITLLLLRKGREESADLKAS
ncbi:MAG: prolipoprotein diacylglyceryl transferase, partial [Chlamydiia bacterium]|nr:prolipoprotein diacylglyceryl transferase [Chlamydiia bacterium]